MLAEKPWRIDAVIRLFLGVISTFCLGALLGGTLEHYGSGWPKAQMDFWQIIISALFLELPALVWIAIFLYQHQIGWKEAFGFNMTEPVTAVAYGVLTASIFVPAAWALQMFSSYVMQLVHLVPKVQEAVEELQDPSLNVAEKCLLGVITIVLAPLIEEALFRGILYPALKRTGRRGLALWVSSILFALAHANVATFVPLLAFALVLVYLYETFQNLLAPIVAHSLFNAANFFVLIFEDQIDHLLHWLHLSK